MANQAEQARNTTSSESTEQPRQLGKYELIAMIGEGGMAEVYLARQRGPMNFEKIVVVKTIHKHLARKDKFIKMLLDEARIAALLKHPCVVDIYDLGFADDTHFIAMEHLAGEPLLAVLRAGIKKKPLDIPSTARLIADVADGLHAAHDLADPSGKPLQLVHRDITPGNIIVLYTGQVKIVDFGIAKARGRLTEDTDADHFKGKLGYISPEQVKGDPIDRRADIFSLGVVLWEALALRRLFRKDTPAAAAEAILRKNIPPPSKFRSSVPPRLDSICLKALARDPEDRYQTAEELANDIERFLSAGSFRPHKATIRKYMQEVFADNKKSREELLKRVVEATTSIQLALPARDPEKSDGRPDEDLPAGPMFTGPLPLLDKSALEDRTPSGHGQVARQRTVAPEVTALGGAGGPDKKKLWTVLGVGFAFLLILIAAAASGGGGESKSSKKPSSTNLAAKDPPVTPSENPDGPDGVQPDGVQPDGVQPDGVQPDGVEPDGVQPDGTEPDGTEPDGTEPDGTEPDGTEPDGTLPADAGVPDAADMVFAPDPIKEEPRDRPKDKPEDKKKPRGSAKDLYNKGIKLFVDGKLRGARAKFKQALDVNSNYAQAYRGLGMVYQRQGNKKKAVSSFKKYLKLAPRAKDAKSIKQRIKSLGG